MNKQILFETIVGSVAFGTNTPESDEDRRRVYIQDPNEILGFKYQSQVENTKDDVEYEIRRFMELLMVANPNALEILYSPTDCIVYCHPVFQILIDNRDKFLTKQCKDSFGGFAVQQIRKSKGHDKKMNWEAERTVRKGVLDFCYVVDGGKTKNVQEWLTENKLLQENCGLVGLNHMPDCYCLYYDKQRHVDGIYRGYKGICSPNGNDVILSSIPKGETPLTTMVFNKNAYSISCREYREYENWLENRNMNRFVENAEHGQKVNGKNLLHSRRLVDTALEIAETGTLNVRCSPEKVKQLLSIRRGEVPLTEIITNAETDIARLDEAYAVSNLPDRVDQEFAHKLLIEIRNVIQWKK